MANRSIGEYRKLEREPSKTVWDNTLPKIKKLLDVKFYEQGTSEWLARRDAMLTASDVAAAIGTNPYQTANSLFDKKTHRGKRRYVSTAATRWGHTYEDEARKLYEQKTGEFVYEFGVIPHPVHTWIGGSPDGVTATGRLLEIKCPISRAITHEIPIYYVSQVQILMECLDLEVCDFVQYRPGSSWNTEIYDCLEVPRDREWFRKYLPIMKTFWDKVLAQRAKMTDSETVLRDKAARVIQWTHRRFRENVCRPEGTRLKEAARNQNVALKHFQEAKQTHEADQAPAVKPRKRRKVVEVTVDVGDADYAIDDTII